MARLEVAFSRLAHRLTRRLGEVRERGRTRRTDPVDGLAIERGDAEGILAELTAAVGERGPNRSDEVLSAGVASFDHAADVFGLSNFERDALLLALAPEVDARFCRLFGFLNDAVAALRPTVGLAMAVLAPSSPEQLAAFLPPASLLRLGLLALDGESPLTGRTLRIPADLWPRLAGLDSVAAAPPRRADGLDALDLAPSTAAQAAVGVRALGDRTSTLVVVHGDQSQDAVAAAIAGAGGPFVIANGLEDAARRAGLVRDALWRRATLVIERGAALGDVLRMCHEAAVPIVAALDGDDVPEAIRCCGRTLLEVAIAPLDDGHRRRLWGRACGGIADIDVGQLAARYRFDSERIAATAALAHLRAASRGGAACVDDVLDACRTIAEAAARSAGHLVGKLGQRYEGDELVVPLATRLELELFEAAAREGHRVLERAGAIHDGPGFFALFAGPSGTGKTLAAQVIARRLRLDVFRVDLSQVVDKYIGETEKHLERVFRACEMSGAILFFDEADALFGKRTETKSAHDRYANIEVSFLLQRLERHPGVVVLATNLRQNIDGAFLRRLQFVVDFPLPDVPDRRRIWELHLRRARADASIDLDFLARFALSGGDISNAVVTAAILGTVDDTITMKHLAMAVGRELRKGGRLSQPGEFGPWSNTVVAYLRDGILG